MDVAANNSKQNVEALLSLNAEYIVSACPTCTVALKKQFIKDLIDQDYKEDVIKKHRKSLQKLLMHQR